MNQKFKKIDVFADTPIIGKLAKDNKMAFGHLYIWVFLGILPTAMFFLVSHFDKNLVMEGAAKGLTEDFAFWGIMVYVPCLASLGLYHFPHLGRAFHSLRDVIVFEGDKLISFENESLPHKPLSFKRFNEMLSDYEDLINGRGKYFKWKIIAVMIGLGWVTYAGFKHWSGAGGYGWDIWSSHTFPLSFWLRTAFETVLFGFIMPCFVFKMIMVIFSMRSICKKLSDNKSIKLCPLNPDKAGGLGALGSFSLRVVTLLIPPAAAIIVYLFVNGINDVITILSGLFLLILVFAFFYPLSGAHSSMKYSKYKELSYLSGEFNQVYYSLVYDMRNGNIDKIADKAAALKDLDDLYKKAEKMPVWPFDSETLMRFASIPGTFISAFLLEYLLKQV